MTLVALAEKLKRRAKDRLKRRINPGLKRRLHNLDRAIARLGSKVPKALRGTPDQRIRRVN
jgi:hypothetical protein